MHMLPLSSPENPTGPVRWWLGILAGLVLILACAAPPVARLNTIAVWRIDNASALSEQDFEVGELFAMQVAEAIQKKGVHRIVERERLILALEELNLSTTSLVDEQTRLKLGRLVGAHYMVLGAYQVFARQMRIDLRLVEVETGNIVNAVTGTARDGGMDDWIKTVQDTALDLL